MSQDSKQQRGDIYQQITDKIISHIEAGILPWVQPWQGGLSLPSNASTQKAYSGVNILLPWGALFTGSYVSNKWATFKQTLAMGARANRCPGQSSKWPSKRLRLSAFQSAGRRMNQQEYQKFHRLLGEGRRRLRYQNL